MGLPCEPLPNISWWYQLSKSVLLNFIFAVIQQKQERSYNSRIQGVSYPIQNVTTPFSKIRPWRWPSHFYPFASKCFVCFGTRRRTNKALEPTRYGRMG